MLIQFHIENFLSINKPVTLDLSAINKISGNEKENFLKAGNTNLLKYIAMYGANASGKSNIIKGIDFFKNYVITSSKDTQHGEPIKITPFKLNTASVKKPTLFEVKFCVDKEIYRYGYEINSQKVINEWLFKIKNNKEVNLFFRQNSTEYSINEEEFHEGINIKEQNLTRENALFLSVNAQFNGNLSTKLISWFSNINIISGIDDYKYGSFTMTAIHEVKSFKKIILDIIKIADIGIEDIKTKALPFQFPPEMPEYVREQMSKDIKDIQKAKSLEINTIHNLYNKNKKVGRVKFDLEKEESDGTRKFFNLLGPIFDSIVQNKILFIDEIGSNLHPILIMELIDLFCNITQLKNTAQFVFTTHDTNLLNYKTIRRDQIYFTEKNKLGETDLYSLAEFKIDGLGVRKDANIQKNYIKGKYGGVPFVGDFKKLLDDKCQESKK